MNDQVEPSAGVRTGVLAELERLRQACALPDSGCSVMEAVALCAVHDLKMPRWLAEEFVLRRRRVTEAEVVSWDAVAAFGRPWPARTRPATVRKHLKLKKLIHKEAWALVEADPSRSVNRLLFDEVGELPGVSLGGSTTAKLYYAAVDEGALNLLTLRHAQRPER